MLHVNGTVVIKSSSAKMAEWVKRLKAHKAEQLEKLRNVEKCDFDFLFWFFCLPAYCKKHFPNFYRKTLASFK